MPEQAGGPPKPAKPRKRKQTKPRKKKQLIHDVPDQFVLSRAQMCYALVCDINAIDALVADGKVIRYGRNQYLLFETLRTYIPQLREMAAGRAGKAGGISPAEENALFRREQRMLAQRRREHLEGQLISIEELKEVWAGIINAFRAVVLAIPNELAIELPHLTVDDRKAIKQVVEKALRDQSIVKNPDIGPLPEPKDSDTEEL